jgi:hypothetical protein
VETKNEFAERAKLALQQFKRDNDDFFHPKVDDVRPMGQATEPARFPEHRFPEQELQPAVIPQDAEDGAGGGDDGTPAPIEVLLWEFGPDAQGGEFNIDSFPLPAATVTRAQFITEGDDADVTFDLDNGGSLISGYNQTGTDDESVDAPDDYEIEAGDIITLHLNFASGTSWNCLVYGILT